MHPVIDPMIAPAKTGAMEDSRGPLDWLINAFLFVLVAIVAIKRVHGLFKFTICTLELITSPVNSAEDHTRLLEVSLLKLPDLSDCKLFFQTLMIDNDDQIMMIKRGKIKKTTKTKRKFHGEELLGPQASLRVTPCPPAPNHTRGEVIRPPSQIKNNSYSVIRTRDLDDLTCTRCAPTITSRPS